MEKGTIVGFRFGIIQESITMEVEPYPWESPSVFGIAIPPSKVAAEVEGIIDKGSEEYQKQSWNALERVIDHLVGNASPENMKQTVAQLFADNIVRGKGLFCTSLMKYQRMSPRKTYLYATLAYLVNSRFPAVGSLPVRRVYMQFMLAYVGGNFKSMSPCLGLIPHLIN